jgi:hypothetical protein
MQHVTKKVYMPEEAGRMRSSPTVDGMYFSTKNVTSGEDD